MDVHVSRATRGRPEEAKVRSASPQYRSQALQRRNVGTFICEIRHLDLHVDDRLGCEPRHGRRTDVIHQNGDRRKRLPEALFPTVSDRSPLAGRIMNSTASPVGWSNHSTSD